MSPRTMMKLTAFKVARVRREIEALEAKEDALVEVFERRAAKLMEQTIVDFRDGETGS